MSAGTDSAVSTSRECTVLGCGRPVASRDYCITHYRRWQRHGTPRPDVPIAERCHRPDLDTNRIARLYRAGASAPGIARLLGTSRSAIYSALRQANAPPRPPGHRSIPAELITEHEPPERPQHQ